MPKSSRVSPKIFQVFLAVVSVLFLVACGGGGGNADAAPSPDPVKLSKASALRFVPLCDIEPTTCSPSGYDISKWLAYGRLTDFALTVNNPGGSISLAGAGDFFPGFSLSLPLTLTYDGASSSWVSKSIVGQGVVRIAIDVDIPDPTGSYKGSVLQVCNSAGECIPYALAQPVEMCKLVTDPVSKKVDVAMLKRINNLQKINLQVNCPIDYFPGI